MRAGGRSSAVRAVGATFAVAVGGLVAIELLDFDPSVGNRRFHVALEVADSVLLVLVAAVMLGRFRSDRSRRQPPDVLRLRGVGGQEPAACVQRDLGPDVQGDEFIVWSTAANGVLGAGLLAASSVIPDRRIRRTRQTGAIALAVSVATVVLVTGLMIGAVSLLPDAFTALSQDATELPLLSGHPLKIGIDILTGACYAVAAVSFARLADQHDDELMRWLGISSAFASVAFVAYALWPSRFTQLVYAGELLWIGAIAVLLYGAVREISNLEAALVRSAVREERKRVARDLHDGVVQELAYIATHTRWLVEGPKEPERPALVKILDSVERALDESRARSPRSTATLTSP